MLMHMPGQRRTVFCRGLSLFGALLALALLGMIVLAASTFFETLAAERRARIAVQQLTVLADASASHVHGRFPELLAAARGGPWRSRWRNSRAPDRCRRIFQRWTRSGAATGC